MEGHQDKWGNIGMPMVGVVKNVKLMSGWWKIVKNCWRMHSSKFPAGSVKNKAVAELFYNLKKSRVEFTRSRHAYPNQFFEDFLSVL